MRQAKTPEEAGLDASVPPEQWEALERAAVGAGVIQSALTGKYPSGEKLACPAFRIGKSGDIEALIPTETGLAPLFEQWPSKFGQLAFGFLIDHLEAGAPDLLNAIRQKGEEMVLGPFSLPIRPGVGFAPEARPSKKGATALLALCKRMAKTPDWLMRELEKMDRQGMEPDAAAPPASPAEPNPPEAAESERKPFLDRATAPKVK